MSENEQVKATRLSLLANPANRVINPIEEVKRLSVSNTTALNTYINPNITTFSLAKLGVDSQNNPPGTGLTLGGLYGQVFSGSWRSTISTGNIGTLPLSSGSLYTEIYNANLGDNYGQIWIGYFLAPETGTYTFWTSSDDGSGVWVGEIAAASSGRTTSNATVNNNMGGGQGNTERSGTISLTEGTFYPIRIVHEEGTGGDNMYFHWASPSISKTRDLTQHFYYAGDGSNFADTTPTNLNTIGYTDTSNLPPEVEYITDSAYELPVNFTKVQRFKSEGLASNNPINEGKLRLQVNSGTSQYNGDTDDDFRREITKSRAIVSDVSSGGGGGGGSSGPVQSWY